MLDIRSRRGGESGRAGQTRGGQARLAVVPGPDTWRQWVWHWDATPGRHVLEARATDKTGYTQTSVLAPPAPDGASGYPMVSAAVRLPPREFRNATGG